MHFSCLRITWSAHVVEIPLATGEQFPVPAQRPPLMRVHACAVREEQQCAGHRQEVPRLVLLLHEAERDNKFT